MSILDDRKRQGYFAPASPTATLSARRPRLNWMILAHTTPSYPVWVVCLCTGLACSAFGRLFGVDWPAFFPVLFGTAIGQWIRHDLIVRKQNIFIVSGIVSFAAAFLAGSGARLLGSLHPETATVAAVLLLVPGWRC